MAAPAVEVIVLDDEEDDRERQNSYSFPAAAAVPVSPPSTPAPSIPKATAKAQRPLRASPFLLFCQERWPSLRASSGPNISMQDVSRKLGEMWRALSGAEREEYRTRLATAVSSTTAAMPTQARSGPLAAPATTSSSMTASSSQPPPAKVRRVTQATACSNSAQVANRRLDEEFSLATPPLFAHIPPSMRVCRLCAISHPTAPALYYVKSNVKLRKAVLSATDVDVWDDPPRYPDLVCRRCVAYVSAVEAFKRTVAGAPGKLDVIFRPPSESGNSGGTAAVASASSGTKPAASSALIPAAHPIIPVKETTGLSGAENPGPQSNVRHRLDHDCTL